MLDQHLGDIGALQRGVDRLLDLLEERDLRRRILGAGLALLADPLAQRLEDGGEVFCELVDRFAKIADRFLLIGEEPGHQRIERFGVGHVGLGHAGAILYQHRALGVLVDDVGARVALGFLRRDFRVEIVLAVLGFPIAEGDADVVDERSVDVDVAARSGHLVLGKIGQIVGPPPALEQALKGIPDRTFVEAPPDLDDAIEFAAVFVDQLTAQAIVPLRTLLARRKSGANCAFSYTPPAC